MKRTRWQEIGVWERVYEEENSKKSTNKKMKKKGKGEKKKRDGEVMGRKGKKGGIGWKEVLFPSIPGNGEGRRGFEMIGLGLKRLKGAKIDKEDRR